MAKKLIFSAIAVLLAVAVIFSTVALCLFAIGIRGSVEHNGVAEAKKPTPAAPAIGSSAMHGVFEVADLSGRDFPTYGNAAVTVSGGTLTSYTTGGGKFTLNTTVGTGITDSVALSGTTVATVFYSADDMRADVITVKNNIIAPVYGEARTDALIVNDGTMSFEYGPTGAISSVIFLDKEVRHLVIGEGGEITAAGGIGSSESYEYENGALIGTAAATVTAGTGSVKVSHGGSEYEYRFNHSYLGASYLSEIYVNGALYASYSYVCDAVASVEYSNSRRIDYILDSQLNCLGMITGGETYSFIYTPDGNVFAILDSSGVMVTHYDVLAYGVRTTDPHSLCNTVLARGVVADPQTGAVIKNGAVILGGTKTAPTGESFPLLFVDALPLGNAPLYADRCALSTEEAIRAKVIDEVLLKLEGDGYASASSLSVTNGSGEELGIADIYVLPDEAAGQSIKNALYGNKIFAVIKEGEDRAAASARLAEYCRAESDTFVDYFDLYKPTLGELKFEGQFVYLGCLIGYSASGGIISYGIYENDSECYKYYNNIYDYDRGLYAMYSTTSFSLDDWDHTALIPGVNREVYDVVESYVDEALEICSYTTFDNVEYYDRGYYDSYVNSAYGDTLDRYVELDPTAMVTLSESGDITVKAVPFFEQTEVRKEFYKAVAGAVVATVVAGVISIAIPGSGVVFIAIMKTAIITGLSNMVMTTAFAIGTDIVKEELLGIELNESFNERVHRYVITALNAYSLGVVTGAVMGGLRFAKFKNASGLDLADDVSASDRMQFRLEALDKNYSPGLLDDSMAARQEYESCRMLIESTDYSLKAISKNVVYCTGKDVRHVKTVISGFDKAKSLAMMYIGGDD